MDIKDTPLISIAVPSYNQGRYIGATLDSLYFQDYPNLEIVVVDDASTDDTREVLDAFARAVAGETASYVEAYDEGEGALVRRVHPRYSRPGRSLTILHNEQNIGAAHTYNRGLKALTGEFCSFVVSDDLCHPQMLSTLARELRSGTADFAYADMLVIDDDHRILREFTLPDYSFQASFCDWYLCGVATLYRRSLHQRFGYFKDLLANDHECYLRFAVMGARFTHVPHTLYSVRSHAFRATGLHTPDNASRILAESERLCLWARDYASGRCDAASLAALWREGED